MYLEILRLKPTRRRWLPIGRVHDGRGHLQGFTLCWWTGLLVVLVHRGKRVHRIEFGPLYRAPRCRCLLRPVMGTDRVINRDDEEA